MLFPVVINVPKEESIEFRAPFSEDHRRRMRRWAGRFGLDFVVSVVKYIHKQLNVTFEGVVGATMSSTGFQDTAISSMPTALAAH